MTLGRPTSTVRSARALAGALVALASAPALGAAAPAAPAPAAPTRPLADDPVLARLVAESLAARPELAAATAAAHAERERVPQAGAPPDPMVSLGIQNDGFGSIEIGKMPTSYWQVMVTQPIPWPGKLGLRTQVAELGAKTADATTARVRLSTEADVRRAYVDLVLARDRLGLLDELEGIWRKSAAIARTRYEAGEAAQSDVLRAQLELNRLRQRRWALEAGERTAVQALNRLRSRPLDTPIPTTATLRDVAPPALPDEAAAAAAAEARSPELAEARLGARRADAQVALARRDRYPDLSVSAGVMARGDFPPMWTASVGVTLPVWSGRKQGRAVAESEARASAGASDAAAVDQVLRERVEERRTALAALLESLRLYREGLLVQSQATADSTLAQYQVGKVTFASVLEANVGYVNDEDGFLEAAADAQRIAIASDEVSLDPVAAAGAGALSAAAIPGAGGMPSGAGRAMPGGAGAASSPTTSSPASSGM